METVDKIAQSVERAQKKILENVKSEKADGGIGPHERPRKERLGRQIGGNEEHRAIEETVESWKGKKEPRVSAQGAQGKRNSSTNKCTWDSGRAIAVEGSSLRSRLS